MENYSGIRPGNQPGGTGKGKGLTEQKRASGQYNRKEALGHSGGGIFNSPYPLSKDNFTQADGSIKAGQVQGSFWSRLGSNLGDVPDMELF